MELILENADLILTCLVILISAVILARRGQIQLLRELIFSLSSTVDTEDLYERLPTITKLLVSDKTVSKLVDENRES